MSQLVVLLVTTMSLKILWFDSCSCGLVADWGESCNFTAECGDHRMLCRPVDGSTDNRSKICTCDSFHEWQGKEWGCIQKYDAQTILKMTMTNHDTKGKLEKEADFVFLGQQAAGLFMICVALCCPLVVAIHCFHMKRKDCTLKEEVGSIEERVEAFKKRRAKLNV